MVPPAPADAEARSELPRDGQGEAGPSRPRRPPEFYSSVFAQIEEVGWERLVSAAGDDGVSCLTFRVLDEHGRNHLLEITLPMNYPACPPSIGVVHFVKLSMLLSQRFSYMLKLVSLPGAGDVAGMPGHFLLGPKSGRSIYLLNTLIADSDVPYLPKLRWTKNSSLKDVLCQFQEHLKILQDHWCIMDDIDKELWVVDPTNPSYAMSHRCIALGDDCYILLHVDAHKPSSLPECRFLGTDGKLDGLIMNWRKNRKKWSAEKKFHENLATILDFALPPPPSVSIKDDEQADCGICYAKHLPIDDELGTHSGCATDYTCENPSCSRAFHSVCLRDWLRTITTTRQSFDVLFGNCPYCSEPVAVKITDR